MRHENISKKYFSLEGVFDILNPTDSSKMA